MGDGIMMLVTSRSPIDTATIKYKNKLREKQRQERLAHPPEPKKHKVRSDADQALVIRVM